MMFGFLHHFAVLVMQTLYRQLCWCPSLFVTDPLQAQKERLKRVLVTQYI